MNMMITEFHQISNEKLKRFRQVFFPDTSTPFALQRPDEKWQHVKDPRNYVGIYRIRHHLQGTYWLGTKGRDWTKCIAFDIDRHHGESDADLIQRAESILNLFPNATPLIFSTPGDGLNLTYLLAYSTNKQVALNYVKDKLDAAGIRLKGGSIELFPSRGTPGKILRVPLGADSLLVDSYNWKPIHYDRLECFHALDWTISNQKIDYLHIPQNYKSPRKKKKRIIPRVNLPLNSDNSFLQRIEKHLTEGCSPKGANDAYLDLNWFFGVKKGLDKEQRFAAIKDWIDRMNNGNSEEYNLNPENAYKHIQRIIDSSDFSNYSHPIIISNSPSSKDKEIELIRVYVAHLPIHQPAKELLEEMMTYAFNKGTKMKNNWYKVDIPSRTFKSWRRKDYRLQRDKLQKKRYIRLIKEHSCQEKQCATYSIHLPARIGKKTS